jgi:hypothetical protein
LPGFLEDADLLERSDAILRPSATGGTYPSWWHQAVSDANAQAASWLMGRLMASGITAAQALTWAGGIGWQAELGLYFLSCRARLDLARSNDESIVKELPDPRQSWENVPLLDASNNLIVPVVVTGVESGVVGYGVIGRKGANGRPLRGERMYDSCSPDGFKRF